jgi:hypothetical protein
MKRFVLIALIAAGCTTPSDLRQRQPSETFHTDKDVAQVTQCLAEKLQGVGTPRVIQAEKETILTFRQGAASTIMFSITPYGTINVRRLHAVVPYHDAIARCI